MEKIDAGFSIVITALNHNPTILNPDFLIRNEIVPSDWPLDNSKPILTTPAFSQLAFGVGISFQIDSDRIKISDSAPTGEIFPVPEIAAKFMETLPHVNYQALGINFDRALLFSDVESARLFQRQAYLKDGPWNMSGALSEFVAKFIYTLEDCQCNLSFGSPKKVKLDSSEDEPRPILVLSANFHRHFGKIGDLEQRIDAFKKAISNWESDKATFESITEKLTRGE